MTFWARALLGSLVGATLTLAIHPTARQFLLGALHIASPRAVAEGAHVQANTLPTPNNTVGAGIWLQLAAEKVLAKEPLKPAELKTLVALAKQGSIVERQNAFWLQMAAVFESYLRDTRQARLDWIRASRCETWNDLQTKRLLQMRSNLARRGGLNQAWTYGYVYFQRSDAPAQVIERYAQQLVSNSDPENLDGLNLRYATICNGALLRDGSRSIRVGYQGAEIIEFATYPRYLSNQIKHYKRIWIAQTSLTAKLRQAELTDEARRADNTFRENEGWLALVQRQSPEENLRLVCMAAIGFAALPGSLLICALVGLVAIVGVRFCTRLNPSEPFRPLWTLPLGVFLALLVYRTTGAWIAALACGAALNFTLVFPRAVRKSTDETLGFAFSFIVGCVSLLVIGSLCAYVVSSSTAGSTLLPLLGPTGEYLSDSRAFLAITCVVLSLLFLVAPAWSLIRKQPTGYALLKSSQRLGTDLCLLGLILCAISGPISVYGDRLCGSELQKIVENEPVYYLLK